ncbi:MAG: hypothetical protein KAU36_02465 [candidate division Zixibacteria bacterium]|nr:hypothetical protein [candidate division Zixibacteria bacterium]
MPSTLLRAESVQPAVNSRLKDFRAEFGLSDGTMGASIVPLLTGLSLNGRITDIDREFLDSLAPARSLTFLISDETYVHPEQVELFPYDVIESTVSQGGPAMFGHRYHPPHLAQAANGHKIYTSLISTSDQQPVILGFFGPEYELDRPEVQQRFSCLVRSFTTAFEDVAHGLSRIEPVLNSADPVLIVNRASGRILAASEHMATEATGTQPVEPGIEYCQVKESLAGLLANRRMEIKRLEAAGMSLSAIFFPEREADRVDDVTATECVINRIRASLSGITLANSLLSQHSPQDPVQGVPRLAAVALEEADKIEVWLRRAWLISEFKRLPIDRTTIDREMRRAIESVADSVQRRKYFDISGEIRDIAVHCPADSYLHLFSTILSAHKRASGEPCTTRIEFIRPDGNNNAPRIKIITSSKQCVGSIERDHRQYCQTLASMLGTEIEGPRIAGQDKVYSSITVNRYSITQRKN